MTFEEIKALDQARIMNTYGRSNLCVVKGSGSCCTGMDGKTYIDFTTGIGVNSLGFCDPDWVKAVSDQAATLQHISNLYYTTRMSSSPTHCAAAQDMPRYFSATPAPKQTKAPSRSPENTASTNTAQDVTGLSRWSTLSMDAPSRPLLQPVRMSSTTSSSPLPKDLSMQKRTPLKRWKKHVMTKYARL